MKEFNTTGVCIPEKHYMVDISDKLAEIEKMVKKGNYFTINRPRQYGKTTTLFLLEKDLEKEDYLVLRMSFEDFDQEIYSNQTKFIEEFLLSIRDILSFKENDELVKLVEKEYKEIDNMKRLSRFITKFSQTVTKNIVLMIDEVDKSSNNQLFLDFLGMLRNKYLFQEQKQDYSFHSVILAGVHDVKNLKAKLRPDEERKYNSPWNIAVDFEVEMDFNVKEIMTMLADYKKDRDVEMDINDIAERIYYYTSGQPFLVSKLAEIIDDEIIPEKDKKEWQVVDVDDAVQILLKQSNTNFESLIKNLENNNDLYKLVRDIILEGRTISYNLHNPLIETGENFGIFKERDNVVKIHNKIYEQVVYDYMVSKVETDVDAEMYNFRDNFISKSDKLNMRKVLTKFQQFIKEEYSDKDIDFLERNGRLLFLAFIKPIINSKGFDFKEVQISQEKRLDVVITYLEQKYIVELKIWRGKKYHKKGIKQLADYLDNQGLDKGYLISYDFNKNKKYRKKDINYEDKEIFAIWV